MTNLIYALIFSSFLPVSYFSINTGFFQLSIFRILLIFVALATLYKIVASKEEFGRIHKTLKVYSVFFHFVWMVYAIISYFWVIDKIAWFKSVYFLGLGLFSIFLMNYFLRNIQEIKTAILIIAVVIFLNTIIGYYEVFTTNYHFLDEEIALDYASRRYPVSWFYNPNDFAMLMLVGFNIMICLANQKYRYKWINLFFLLESSLIISLIFVAKSRANIIGIEISIIVLLVFYFVKKRRKQIATLIYVLALSVIILILLNKLGLYDYGASSLSFGEDRDISISNRVNLIKNGLIFLYRTYGFGVGAGNIEYWMAKFAVYPVFAVNMHNWWAELLTAYGILILIGYLVFYGRITIHSLYIALSYPTESDESNISVLIVSMMAGLSIGLIGSSSNFGSEWLWIFMAIFSVLQMVIVPQVSKDSSAFENLIIKFCYFGQMKEILK